MANEGELRVWWIPQLPGTPFYVDVASVPEAKKVLEILARYDLFQLEQAIKPDFTNAGGLEVFEYGEWVEWMDDEGNGIEDVARVEPASPDAVN